METITLVIDREALEAYERVYFERHPRAHKKPIANPYHESMNQWMIMKRPMMNAIKQRWKEFMVFFVRNSEYKDLHIEECSVRFTTYYKSSNRHDIDNGCPKFILDGLCESGLIVDDDSKHITCLTMQCYTDTANPRTEIEIDVRKTLTKNNSEFKEEKTVATKKATAKQTKRVSVNAMDEIMKDVENVVHVEWKGLDVEVKKFLSLQEMLDFVDSVVKSCFHAETGEYLPQVKDFAIRCNVLEHYAHFALPRKIETQYDIVMQSGAYEMIQEHINESQFTEMLRSIDAKVKHIADANAQAALDKVETALAAINDFSDKMSEMFSGVGAEDIANVMKAISDHGLDETKLVEAYVAQQKKVAQ